MTPFTFFHAADFHLGSPFKGVSARLPHLLDALQQATATAFNALVALCIEKEAAFLLVAGDVFDDADRSLGAQLTFRDGVATAGYSHAGGSRKPRPATRLGIPDFLAATGSFFWRGSRFNRCSPRKRPACGGRFRHQLRQAK